MFIACIAVISVLCTSCFARPVAVASQILVPVEQQLDPSPYEFGYEFSDGLGTFQHRKEISDASGVVKGSYGYIDPVGVGRTVEYTANGDGYRAIIHSNEPGTANQNSADALFIVQPAPLVAVAEGLRGRLSNVIV